MCNSWCLAFARSVRGELGDLGAVLEVGARQVNGGVRDELEPASASYLGVDLQEGPGVDRVGSVHDLARDLGGRHFDLVVSTEMLEHCEDWRDALWQLVERLVEGGHLLLTTRTPGFALHGYPDDHWRFTAGDLRRALEPVCEVVRLEHDRTLGWACGIGVLARRRGSLAGWREHLAGIEVAPVDRSRGEGVHHPPIELDQEARDALREAAAILARHRDTPEARWFLARNGFHLSPTGPRSAIASFDDLQASFEHLQEEPPAPVAALFDLERQLALLRELAPHSQELLQPPAGALAPGHRRAEAGGAQPDQSGPHTAPTRATPGVDERLDYALLRRLRPARVVHHGNARTAAVARAALDTNGDGELIVLAEAGQPPSPHAHRTVELRDGLAGLRAEELVALLGTGALLSLETSHVLRSGSDCARLYLELLPSLRGPTWIHLQGVYLPGPYPKSWVERLGLEWNEHYTLAAWLLDNRAVRVQLGAEFLRRESPDLLRELLPGLAALDGSGLWLEILPGDE